jgi:hypothetical protein
MKEISESKEINNNYYARDIARNTYNANNITDKAEFYILSSHTSLHTSMFFNQNPRNGLVNQRIYLSRPIFE